MTTSLRRVCSVPVAVLGSEVCRFHVNSNFIFKQVVLYSTSNKYSRNMSLHENLFHVCNWRAPTTRLMTRAPPRSSVSSGALRLSEMARSFVVAGPMCPK